MLFINVIILSLLLTGCQNPLEGQTEIYYDIQCIKTSSSISLGISTKGDPVITPTTTCIRSECFKMERIQGKYKGFHKEIRLNVMPISKCIKDDT